MDSALSYGNPQRPSSTDAVQRADLNMLESTGAPAVTVDLGYQPWLDHNNVAIAQDDRSIARIRSTGKLLVLKDAASESYRRHPLSWPQFEAAWVARVRTLAARYHPAYYTVIKEPGWYVPMVAGLSRNPTSAADRSIETVATWTTLLRELARAVLQVSPSTKVGISIPADSLYHGAVPIYPQLMEAAATTPGVAFLGFDLYNTWAFTDMLRFLSKTRLHGRSIWINESWTSPSWPVASEPSRAQLDATWMPVLYRFALYVHAAGLSPFFTNLFAAYGTPPSTTNGLLRYYSGRTSVFRAFRRVVAAEQAGRT
jgi:hypothetical protein